MKIGNHIFPEQNIFSTLLQMFFITEISVTASGISVTVSGISAEKPHTTPVAMISCSYMCFQHPGNLYQPLS